MGGLGVPSPTSGAMLVFIDRTWGTPRRTNLCVASSKPSTFSRITPLLNRRLPTSRLARAGLVSNTNSGSFGLVACSPFTNAGSMVVLLLAGWQVPQVRPSPLNVSLKKMSAPAQICCVARPVTTRGSCAHAARRSAAVSEDVRVSAAPGSGLVEPSHAVSSVAAVIDANTENPVFANVMARSFVARSPADAAIAQAVRKPRAGGEAPNVSAWRAGEWRPGPQLQPQAATLSVVRETTSGPPGYR